MPRKLPHPATAEDVTELLRIARENPWWQFEEGDIARMMNLTPNAVTMMKRADDTPFANDKARPERVAAFLDKHPGWKPSAER